MVGKVFYFLLLSSFIQFLVIDAASYDEDITITLDEADALVKFRTLVCSKLPHKYMQESLFLVKWFRAQNFDMKAAEVMLLKHIDWRAEKKIDEIDDEDWKVFETDFPWNLDGVDKTGRPVVQMIMKSWKNVSKAVENGQGDNVARWLYKYMEDATKLVRKSQSEGKKVARYSILMDAEGFNHEDFGCPACIPMFTKVSEALDKQFPGSLDQLVIINTSDFCMKMIDQVSPLLSKNMRSAIEAYGTDRKIWRKALSKFMDDDQLMPAFGGTMRAE